MAPAASASDSPNEIVPLFRVLPRRRRRASNRAEDRRHRRLDNGCCPSRRCCRCSGVVVVLCPRHLLREHRHSAATDALVVGATCTILLGLRLSRGRAAASLRHRGCLWRSRGRHGVRPPSARGRSMMWCMTFRRLFACQCDARGRSDRHVLSCRRRVLLQVICANLCARARRICRIKSLNSRPDTVLSRI